MGFSQYLLMFWQIAPIKSRQIHCDQLLGAGSPWMYRQLSLRKGLKHEDSQAGSAAAWGVVSFPIISRQILFTAVLKMLKIIKDNLPVFFRPPSSKKNKAQTKCHWHPNRSNSPKTTFANTSKIKFYTNIFNMNSPNSLSDSRCLQVEARSYSRMQGFLLTVGCGFRNALTASANTSFMPSWLRAEHSM